MLQIGLYIDPSLAVDHLDDALSLVIDVDVAMM
jgi:hypothetical protein